MFLFFFLKIHFWILSKFWTLKMSTFEKCFSPQFAGKGKYTYLSFAFAFSIVFFLLFHFITITVIINIVYLFFNCNLTVTLVSQLTSGRWLYCTFSFLVVLSKELYVTTFLLLSNDDHLKYGVKTFRVVELKTVGVKYYFPQK